MTTGRRVTAVAMGSFRPGSAVAASGLFIFLRVLNNIRFPSPYNHSPALEGRSLAPLLCAAKWKGGRVA
jgi:hypothetical protein